MITAEALSKLPDDVRRYESIEGELLMMSPAGGRHGRVAWRLGMLLGRTSISMARGDLMPLKPGFSSLAIRIPSSSRTWRS